MSGGFEGKLRALLGPHPSDSLDLLNRKRQILLILLQARQQLGHAKTAGASFPQAPRPEALDGSKQKASSSSGKKRSWEQAAHEAEEQKACRRDISDDAIRQQQPPSAAAAPCPPAQHPAAPRPALQAGIRGSCRKRGVVPALNLIKQPPLIQQAQQHHTKKQQQGKQDKQGSTCPSSLHPFSAQPELPLVHSSHCHRNVGALCFPVISSHHSKHLSHAATDAAQLKAKQMQGTAAPPSAKQPNNAVFDQRSEPAGPPDQEHAAPSLHQPPQNTEQQSAATTNVSKSPSCFCLPAPTSAAEVGGPLRKGNVVTQEGGTPPDATGTASTGAAADAGPTVTATGGADEDLDVIPATPSTTSITTTTSMYHSHPQHHHHHHPSQQQQHMYHVDSKYSPDTAGPAALELPGSTAQRAQHPRKRSHRHINHSDASPTSCKHALHEQQQRQQEHQQAVHGCAPAPLFLGNHSLLPPPDAQAMQAIVGPNTEQAHTLQGRNPAALDSGAILSSGWGGSRQSPRRQALLEAAATVSGEGPGVDQDDISSDNIKNGGGGSGARGRAAADGCGKGGIRSGSGGRSSKGIGHSGKGSKESFREGGGHGQDLDGELGRLQRVAESQGGAGSGARSFVQGVQGGNRAEMEDDNWNWQGRIGCLDGNIEAPPLLPHQQMQQQAGQQNNTSGIPAKQPGLLLSAGESQAAEDPLYLPGEGWQLRKRKEPAVGAQVIIVPSEPQLQPGSHANTTEDCAAQDQHVVGCTHHATLLEQVEQQQDLGPSGSYHEQSVPRVQTSLQDGLKDAVGLARGECAGQQHDAVAATAAKDGPAQQLHAAEAAQEGSGEQQVYPAVAAAMSEDASAHRRQQEDASAEAAACEEESMLYQSACKPTPPPPADSLPLPISTHELLLPQCQPVVALASSACGSLVACLTKETSQPHTPSPYSSHQPPHPKPRRQRRQQQQQFQEHTPQHSQASHQQRHHILVLSTSADSSSHRASDPRLRPCPHPTLSLLTSLEVVGAGKHYSVGNDSQLAHAFAIMVPCQAVEVATPLPMSASTKASTPCASDLGLGKASASTSNESSEARRPLLLLSARLDAVGLGEGAGGAVQGSQPRKRGGTARGSAPAAAAMAVPGKHGHVKLLSWQEGGSGWQLERVLEAFAPMYCVLASSDGCSIVAAGKNGCAHMWRLEAQTLAIADSYRLPQAKYLGLALTDIVELQAVPNRPHIVVGCSSSGSLAVWDTWTRQLLAGLQPPGVLAVEAVTPVDLVSEHARRRAQVLQQAAAQEEREQGQQQAKDLQQRMHRVGELQEWARLGQLHESEEQGLEQAKQLPLHMVQALDSYSGRSFEDVLASAHRLTQRREMHEQQEQEIELLEQKGCQTVVNSRSAAEVSTAAAVAATAAGVVTATPLFTPRVRDAPLVSEDPLIDPPLMSVLAAAAAARTHTHAHAPGDGLRTPAMPLPLHFSLSTPQFEQPPPPPPTCSPMPLRCAHNKEAHCAEDACVHENQLWLTGPRTLGNGMPLHPAVHAACQQPQQRQEQQEGELNSGLGWVPDTDSKPASVVNQAITGTHKLTPPGSAIGGSFINRGFVTPAGRSSSRPRGNLPAVWSTGVRTGLGRGFRRRTGVMSTGQRTRGGWGTEGKAPCTTGTFKSHGPGIADAAFTDVIPAASMACTEGTYGDVYSTDVGDCVDGGGLFVLQAELLTPTNPLVLLALVKDRQEGLGLQEDGSCPQQQQQRERPSQQNQWQQDQQQPQSVQQVGEASVRLCPLLLQEGGVNVCSPLPLPPHMSQLGACAVRGPHCVLVGQQGGVVVWDVVQGGVVWGLGCELVSRGEHPQGARGEDGQPGEAQGSAAKVAARKRGAGAKRGRGWGRGKRQQQHQGEVEDSGMGGAGEGSSQQQQQQQQQLGVGSLVRAPTAAAVFCGDGILCAAMGNLLMLCCWDADDKSD